MKKMVIPSFWNRSSLSGFSNQIGSSKSVRSMRTFSAAPTSKSMVKLPHVPGI